ncbi:Protein osb1, mitochondrial-like [Stylosanthes scabra]|uniref:Protein osb1, mitochondrial-like n=1 Tax=Stylosanthes scabra TaxID=79078 RepID=A0ABU6R8M7_9FABA|nr:Protein osb1, mitochondrial-like [Stylosanthes scabra]
MKSKLLRLIPLFFFSTKPKFQPSLPYYSLSHQTSSPFSTFTPETTSFKERLRLSHSFDDDAVSGTSAVYIHTKKFQRPPTIHFRREIENKASFIGTVTRQPKLVNAKSGRFGAFTVLKVPNPRCEGPHRSYLRVLLFMWDRLAELASKHLEGNDYVYVSGCLGSYNKVDHSGNDIVDYKLVVKELDFVARKIGHEEHKRSESIEAADSIQNNQNRLHLWQVFFSNPYEWWDNRKSKFKGKQPDFKHKHTGEVLRLSKYDPPWVRKQLELIDSKIAEGRVMGSRSRVSTWVYDE